MYQFCALICHQVPDRTIYLGRYLPLCARCTGIYTGFFLSIVYQVALFQSRIRKLPSLKFSVLSIFFLTVLILESIISFFGLWSASLNIRLILGLLGGSSIGLFLFPVFNFSLFHKNAGMGISRWKEHLLLMLLLGLLVIAVLSGQPIFYFPLSVFSMAGVLLLFSMIGLVMILCIIKSIHRNFTDRS